MKLNVLKARKKNVQVSDSYISVIVPSSNLYRFPFLFLPELMCPLSIFGDSSNHPAILYSKYFHYRYHMHTFFNVMPCNDFSLTKSLSTIVSKHLLTGITIFLLSFGLFSSSFEKTSLYCTYT